MVLPLPAVQTSGHMKDAARVLFEASCGARFQGALVLVPLPQEDMKGLGHASQCSASGSLVCPRVGDIRGADGSPQALAIPTVPLAPVLTPFSSPAGGTLALLVTAPYARCVCPEGQNVTLSCRVSGPLADRHDLLYKTWYFSSAGDQSCSEKQHIRNLTERELHHMEPGRHHGTAPNGTARAPHGWQGGHRGVEFVPNHHGAFHIVVMNLTLQDSGNYCCYAMEVRREHGKPQTLQVAHGFVELQIQRGEG